MRVFRFIILMISRFFFIKGLLIHLDKWYGPHVQAVLLICKEESFEHDEKTNTKELIDMVLNNLDYPEDIEINEKRVKKDCSNFRAWRCIVPDEMESDVIRAEREHQSPIGKELFFKKE